MANFRVTYSVNYEGAPEWFNAVTNSTMISIHEDHCTEGRAIREVGRIVYSTSNVIKGSLSILGIEED